ncbi:hypothetical protein K7X08_000413 [Anisodus acutangulus]|uniref:Uncharacterized protein n=1 Tax=Anisodus acutangulus TaxID=402998 RepID=A0A9Q1M4A7_9SOLA|nr:hypothetical protein K7X08_000413 [Anisodus acutangulus]
MWNSLTMFPATLVFDLRSNRIKGDLPIPPSSAIFVDCSCNNFTNSIPQDIGNSIALASFFSVANNGLTGRIHESICKASYLQVLDLSNNALNGTIPPCLLNYGTTLGVLNPGNNCLNGVIPDSFPIGCALKTLDLSRNTLEGELPKSLVNCNSLEVLNVGNNRLVDSFPCMLNSSYSLRVLVLRFNQFNGDSFEGNRGLYGFPLNNSCKSNAPELAPSPNSEDNSYDWQFIFTGVGYGVEAAIFIAPLLFYKKGRKYCDDHLERMLKKMFPRIEFTYTRYDPGKVVVVEQFEDETPDDTEDDDEDEGGQEASLGRYCIFCSKLDFHRKEAIHDPKCTCHVSSSSFLFLLHHPLLHLY